MGTALTRLFRDRKDAPYQIAVDANNRLGHLFRDHGEALITALDGILAADERGQGLPYAEAMQRAAKLLAQLEAEAQP